MPLPYSAGKPGKQFYADFFKLRKWLLQLNTLGTAEFCQHLLPVTTALGSPTIVSSDVLSTPITEAFILFFLAIKIYRHTKHHVSHLMECQNFNNVGLQTVVGI